MEHKGPVFKA